MQLLEDEGLEKKVWRNSLQKVKTVTVRSVDFRKEMGHFCISGEEKKMWNFRDILRKRLRNLRNDNQCLS